MMFRINPNGSIGYVAVCEAVNPPRCGWSSDPLEALASAARCALYSVRNGYGDFWPRPTVKPEKRERASKPDEGGLWC
jgi:hypothetical protein